MHETSWKGVLQVVLMLGVIWWMYDGYAWLTNAVPPDRGSRRVFLLAAMAAFLVLALAIPEAFRGSGASFGIAYLAIVADPLRAVRQSTSQRSRARSSPSRRSTCSSALLVLAGGIAGGTAQYVLWALGFLSEWSTPFFLRSGGFVIGAGALRRAARTGGDHRHRRVGGGGGHRRGRAAGGPRSSSAWRCSGCC